MIKEIIKVATSPSPGVISIIASAGAGKTFTLTSVYIALLLKGVHPREILGITFTNKAAEEMQERVIQRLMAITFDLDSNELDLFSESLNMARSEVVEKSKKVLETILFDFSSFSLQTIDSFLNRLRLAFSFELKLSPGADLRPSIYSDTELIVSRMLERAKFEPSIKEAIFRFVNYYSESLPLYRSWDPLSYAEYLFPTYLTKQAHYAKDLMVSSCTSFDLHQVKRVLDKRDQFLKICGKFGVEPVKNVRDLLESLNPRLLSLPKDITSRYLSYSYMDLTQFAKVIKGGGKLEKEILFVLHSAWRDLLEEFYQMEFEFSRSFVWPFLHIYSSIYEELERFQEENDIAYLSLLQLYISKLDPLVVAEKSTARYGRYKYFLIDEFQDTSLSQWKALYPILEEALSSGGMLLCVGDPKQTIYRWRGSEPDMFGRLEKSFSVQIHRFVLPDNWRSAPEIVYFNNRLFAHLPDWVSGSNLLTGIDEDVWQRLRKVYSPVRALQVPKRKYSGQVEIVPVGINGVQNNEEVKQRVLLTLIDYLEEAQGKDRCILVRRRSEAREIIGTLTQRGISVVSDESLALVSHPIIMALVSLLRWIAFPEELMYLRMFFLSDLWAKYSGKEIEFWEKELRFLSNQRLESLVKNLVQGIASSSLYLMISNLIRRLKIREIYPEQSIFIDGFQEILWRWESENGSSLRDFLDYWAYQEESPFEAERLNLPVASDSVRVMTIHSAKGLEFDEVILPFLDLALGQNRGKGLEANLYWEVGDGIEVYYITKRMSERHPQLREIYNREYTLRIFDDVNLLYVAMTRAKRKLALFLLSPYKGKSSWQGLIQSCLEELGHDPNS